MSLRSTTRWQRRSSSKAGWPRSWTSSSELRPIRRCPRSGAAFRQAEAALGHVVAGDLEGATSRTPRKPAAPARSWATTVHGASRSARWPSSPTSAATRPHALELAEQAVLLFGTEGSPAARYAPQFFHGLILLSTDRLDDAAKAFAIGREQCELSGNFATLPIHHLGAGLHLLLVGRMGRCRCRARGRARCE